MTVNSSPEWVGLVDALVNKLSTAAALFTMEYNAAKEAGTNLDHGLDSVLRPILIEALAQHIERVKREARLDEARRMEVVLEGEAALEPISGDGIIGILRRKVRQRIAELEKQG